MAQQNGQESINVVLCSGTSTHLHQAISRHSKVKQHLPFLCTCFKSTGKQRKDMVAYTNKGQIEAIGEIALGLLKGNILVPNSSFEQLKPHKSKLLYLTRKTPRLKQKRVC